MKRLTLILPSVFASLAIVAACADSGEEAPTPSADGGTPDSSESDATVDGAADAPPPDAHARSCSNDYCVVDLPSSGTAGFTKWMFAGVVSDPVIGVWAIANGVAGADESTAQMLHFENGVWTPRHAPTFGKGAAKRALRLVSLSADGAGKLIAVGATIDDGTTVVVRADGTSFSTSIFDGALSAVWFAAPGKAWATGPRGGIYRSLDDGSWSTERSETETTDIHFSSVWGNGPDEVYVGGIRGEMFPTTSYLGRRTVDEAGAPTWTFRSFEDMQMFWLSIGAGVAPPDGPRFWAAGKSIARSAKVKGEDGWTQDPFQAGTPIHAFWARGKDDIWAVGEIGRVLHFDGVAWKDSLLFFDGVPLTANLTAVAGTSAGEIFVVGEGFALRREAK